jgi:hypothetical protein
MRKFNQREQHIIKLISEIEIGSTDTFSRILQEKFFTIKKKNALIVNHISQDILLYINTSDFNDLSKRSIAVVELLELVSLISYLEEEGYLSILPTSKYTGLDCIYEGFNNIVSTKQNDTFTDTDGTISQLKIDKIEKSDGTISFLSISIEPLYETIKKNFLAFIYPSEDIKSLVKNDFKSDEDIKFRKQHVLSWAGLITAIVIGILSILFTVYSIYKNDSNTQKQSLIIKKRIENTKIRGEKEIEPLKSLNRSFEEINKQDSITQKLIERNSNQNSLIIERLKKD